MPLPERRLGRHVLTGVALALLSACAMSAGGGGSSSATEGEGARDVVRAASALPPTGGTTCQLGLPGPAWSQAPAPTFGRSLATGDYNGDGLADFVVASATGLTGVVLGTGGGALGPINLVTNDPDWNQIVVQDFNGDGRPDLILIRPPETTGPWHFAILLGQANGNFKPKGDVTVAHAAGLAAGDFNGDGHNDALVGTCNGVTLFAGVGDGTFQAPVVVSSYGCGAGYEPLTVADFNGDGKADFLRSDGTSAAVLLGKGDGSFQTPLPVSVATPLWSGAGDLDGDGVVDLVVRSGASIAVLLGKGDGTFTTAAPLAIPSVGAKTLITLGDADGDGHLDVVAGNQVFFGGRHGTFSAPTTLYGHYLANQVITDIDGDGRPDIVSQDLVSASVSYLAVHLGQHNEKFAPPPATGTLADVASAMTIGDFNGDAKVDLAVADSAYATIAIRPGKGDGTFGAAINTSIHGTPTTLLAADLNLDGLLDLVAGSTSGALNVLLGKGGGKFTATHTMLKQAPLGVAIGDMDGDGNIDLVVPTQGSSIDILLGDGTGAFAAPTTVHAPTTLAGPVMVADVNGDGRADLVVGGSTSCSAGMIAVLLQSHGLRFSTGQQLSIAGVPFRFAAGDFNADTKVDVAALYDTCSTSQSVGVLLGTGTGTFTLGSPLPASLDPTLPWSLGAADFNRDGFADLLVTGARDTLQVFLNGGASGGFAAASAFPTGATMGLSAVTDFNGDGVIDVVGTPGALPGAGAVGASTIATVLGCGP